MRSSLRATVARRAKNRCEYCRLPQSALDITFHIEHLIARQHGGKTVLANLALACPFCNSVKGSNLTSLDPASAKLVRLFNPRKDKWSDHFELVGYRIRGKTAIGRTTESLLELNSERMLRLRAALIDAGYW
jgi:hypothetical protein